MKRRHGFTLIELLVVIAIIAILTAIVTTNFAQSKAKSRDAKRISDIAQIQLALGLFFDRCNAYPGNITASGANASCGGVTFGNYITTIPKDPVNSSTYQYLYYSNGYDYRLRALLETKSGVLNDSVTSNATGQSQFQCSYSASENRYCVAPN